MSRNTAASTPGLQAFLRSVSSEPIETSIEYYISLLRRRQIQGSKACAIATAHLLRRAISTIRATDSGKLLQRVHDIGKRLVEAAPRELAIGNVVRRILGLIRDEEDNRNDASRNASEAGSAPQTPSAEIVGTGYTSPLSSNGIGITPRRDQDASARPPLLSSHTTMAGGRPVTSMFSILSHPTMRSSGATSPAVRSGTSTPVGFQQPQAPTDLRAEILEGISEIIDELEQSDEQIANYALEHILPSETILTYSSSQTVQRFLLKAASKRKFTVIHAECHPNSHSKTHSMVTGNAPAVLDEDSNMSSESFQKPLISAGITVVLIPDSAIFAIMSRVQKIILSAHAVLSNGSILAPAGSKTILKAAKFHRVPVLVLAATYKLSPVYPHDPENLIEYGDVGKVVPYQDRELREGLDGVRNPLTDFIEGEGNVDLFVTNVGSMATGYIYKVVRDQYRDEDVDW